MVLNAANEPVAGAEVAVVGFGDVRLERGVLRKPEREASHITRTDAGGRFALPALLPNPTLLAVHYDQGFAEVPNQELAATGTITLKPWGHVVGTLKQGPRPAAATDGAGYRHNRL